MLAKNLENINTDLPITVIDIDENTQLASEYNIRGVPTLVMLEDEKEIKRMVGVKSLKELDGWING